MDDDCDDTLCLHQSLPLETRTNSAFPWEVTRGAVHLMRTEQSNFYLIIYIFLGTGCTINPNKHENNRHSEHYDDRREYLK
jgi:hypothetical protein